MRFDVSRKQLIAAVKAVQPAVATRPGLPILAGVRIDAGGELLSVKATDLELSIEQFVKTEVSVERAGAAVVPAKALVKALGVASGDRVAIEAEAPRKGGRPVVEIRSGSRSFSLDGYPTEDWPAFPSQTEGEPVATADAGGFADALERATLCASKDEARPILTTVALFFEEPTSSMQVVATDSYRLGVVDVPLAAGPSAVDEPLLVPARVAKALAKRLKTEEGEVRIQRGGAPENGSPPAIFSFGDGDWWVRTVDGEFPRWQQVVPEADGGCLEFDPAELDSALEAASVVRGSGAAPVRLALDGSCSLTLREPDLGAFREELESATFSPNGAGALEVAFNPQYLRDGIRFVGEDRGRLWIRDGLKPALFQGSDRRYAVMPVRTS